ncbi:hypothetical protein [Lutibacter sp.]|uniref:hypothetical protein n=1 Tax=Lutibacter sp. TaxID=1925666 RepID=UPI001A280C26|nr:hypothetical protein [Lutibacter sp.]MBI9042802.1 hypothetical protein [Lutibacter sp.]
MKNTYKFLIVFMLLPFAISASVKDWKYTKNKVIKKEFTVLKDATLNVTNKYGNIDIITWNENTIRIEVSITTNGDDEEKVKDKLDAISIDFSGNSNSVSAKTMIEKISNSWSFWGKNNNVSMEINYLIKMPVTNNVNLTNDYGGINIDKLEGSSKINCDYGKLNIGELLNTQNAINIDYTNNSIIQYMKDGAINADYSTLHIEKSGRTKLNADYSHISFGMLVDLDFNCDYGDLKVENAGNIKGNSDYMHTTINKLIGTADFIIDYGSLKISELSSNFKVVKVQSSYTHIKLGVNPTNAFSINASLSYGSLKGTAGFNFNKEISNTSSKYYEGYYNKPTSNSTISIKSSYGSVTFSNN